MVASSLDLGPGTVFGGDFRIVRPLRVGGMGAVYVAEQLSTGTMRALKLMQRELVSDPGLRERFEQEARVGAHIESDHVVQVVGAGVDAATGLPWLAMELLKGLPLDVYASDKGPLPPSEVRFLFEQLCHALGAAHARGIVHRDLKPANVFLGTPRVVGLAYMVKVLDFGIAKVLAESRTTKTAAVGTPLYMAPEQYEAGKVTPATDVWALGLIAFELLTGRSYWKAARDGSATPASIMYETCLGELVPPSSRVADLGLPARLPAGFDAWFAKCVERKPEHRHRDASAAFDALADVLGPAVAPVGALPASKPHEPAREPTRAMTEAIATEHASSAEARPAPTPAVAPLATEIARTEVRSESVAAPRRRNVPWGGVGALLGAAIVALVAARALRSPGQAPATAPSVGPAPSVAPAAVDHGPPSRFASNGTISVEGRLLHSKIAPGTWTETYVMLDLRAADAMPKTPTPVHLSLLIDRSGSMSGDRLKNAVAAALTAIDRLRDGDQVSVITFDSAADVVVEPTVLDSSSRTLVAAAVKKIALGSNTCISCGLTLALAKLGSSPETWARRIVLLSDGEATEGVKDVPSFEKMARDAQRSDVSITTIGLGTDYDPRMLTALARESNGQHYFAASESAMSGIFDAQAKAMASVVATGAEASIELEEGVELVAVLDRAHRVEGSTVRVPLGQFTRGERKTVLLKVAVTAKSVGRANVAGVTIAYRDLLEKAPGKGAGSLALLTGDGAAELDPIVEVRIRRSETAAALIEAHRLFEHGQAKEAEDLLAKQTLALDRQKKDWSDRGVVPSLALVKDLDEQRTALETARKQYQVVAKAGGGFGKAAPTPKKMMPAPAKNAANKSFEDAYNYGY